LVGRGLFGQAKAAFLNSGSIFFSVNPPPPLKQSLFFSGSSPLSSLSRVAVGQAPQFMTGLGVLLSRTGAEWVRPFKRVFFPFNAPFALSYT